VREAARNAPVAGKLISMSGRRLRGVPVENRCSRADDYHMSSEHISVDTAELLRAAGGNADRSAALGDYYRRCQQWLGEVEREIIRCHGVVAAPVAAAMREFYDGLSAKAAAGGADRGAVAAKLEASAQRYDGADAAGADAVRAAGGTL
jgi:hypothetical protein